MDISAVEKDGRMIVDTKQNHTVANLVRKAIWANDGEAAYDKGHPLGGESGLIVESDEPRQVLSDGIEKAREWLDELEDEL